MTCGAVDAAVMSSSVVGWSEADDVLAIRRPASRRPVVAAAAGVVVFASFFLAAVVVLFADGKRNSSH